MYISKFTYLLFIDEFFKSNSVVEEASGVTVGKSLTLPCPTHTRLTLNSLYHWGGSGPTRVWFLCPAKRCMITKDGTLLLGMKNVMSFVIESKGAIGRMAFSQQFLLRESSR